MKQPPNPHQMPDYVLEQVFARQGVAPVIHWDENVAVVGFADCLKHPDINAFIRISEGFKELEPSYADILRQKQNTAQILALVDNGFEFTGYAKTHDGFGLLYEREYLLMCKVVEGSKLFVAFVHTHSLVGEFTPNWLSEFHKRPEPLALDSISEYCNTLRNLLHSDHTKQTKETKMPTEPTNHNLVMKGVSQRGTNYVLYHADSDGRFAGYAASKFLGGLDVDTKYLEVQYGKPFPVPYDQLTRNDTVTILDFSYVRDVMIELSKYVGHITVLDHHEKAEEQLRNIGIDLKCPSYIVFDLKKSGALLAYEHYYADRPVPRGLALINDRDLWTKQFEDSPHLESYLRNELVSNGQGHTWAGWETIWDIMPDGTNAFVEKGKLYGAQEQRTLDKFFKSKRHSFLKITGRKVLIYNCPGYLHSEIAERYYNTFAVDYTLGWRVIENGKQVLLNLRSNNGTNVADIAVGIKDLPGGISGGGHAAAAGATMHITEGMLVILEFLDAAVSKLEDLNDSQD